MVSVEERLARRNAPFWQQVKWTAEEGGPKLLVLKGFGLIGMIGMVVMLKIMGERRWVEWLMMSAIRSRVR